jgi:SNF2 family DNA or RNA helicase
MTTDMDSIVFSAWKQTLNVTQSMFDKCNINFCRVDGELSLPQRKVALQKFRTDASVRVLLMTLGTGGVGQVTPPQGVADSAD